MLTLLIGVAIMHAVIFSTAHAMATESAASSPAAAAHVEATASTVRNEQAPVAYRESAAPMRTIPAVADGSDCDGCTTHAGMHACVFVLVTLALALGLAVIAWLGADRILGGGNLARAGLRRRTRPPPWTVLSLAELAILRI